jgi:hypothetical protein
MENKWILTSLIREINITDCVLELISVRIRFEERLFCLTETCIEVTVQVATEAPRPARSAGLRRASNSRTRKQAGMSFTLLFEVDELIICELKAVDEGYQKNNSVSLVAWCLSG